MNLDTQVSILQRFLMQPDGDFTAEERAIIEAFLAHGRAGHVVPDAELGTFISAQEEFARKYKA
jgi:hypothetical protein